MQLQTNPRAARNHAASCQRQHIEALALYRELEKPMGRIVDLVCQIHLVSRDEILGKSRAQRLIYSRFLAVYLCRELTCASLPMLGRFFRRNHTAMLHACSAMEAWMLREPELAKKIERLKRDVAAGMPRAEAAA